MSNNADPPESTILHRNLDLIQVDDPTILKTLRADADAARLLVPVSDTIAAILPGQWETIVEVLRKMGHIPGIRDNQP
jgi:hypothetical protein